ncbi:MAG: hypothetical protein FJX83_01035 [Bacteroidetes bacterium]|nr:hypothetical protein [Bacteroidota bacterium]
MKFNSPLKYFIFSCILFMLACGSKGDVHEMEGWYTMEQQIFIANGVEDVRDHTKQYKVFSDEYYSYTNMREDTLTTFGFGYYTYDPATKKLVEHNLFNTSLLDSASSFDLQIEPHPAGYKQVIPKIMIAGVPNRLIEDYTRINFNNTSEMDGVWKLTEHYTIENADTVRDTRIQYKIFKGGRFMWLQYFTDKETGAPKKGFGYGEFQLNDGSIVETNQFSSYPSITGVPVNLQLDIIDEDNFTQTITSDTDGSISVEKYTRMPKRSNS